jgi:hypothetical protein
VDATTPRGDGLPARVTNGGAGDATSTRDGRADGSGGAHDIQSPVDTSPSEAPLAGGDGGSGQCGLLLTTECVGAERCYPFPFESPAPGDTRCAFQGVGGPSVPCQSQVECDEMTVCGSPDQPDSVCLLRCSLTNPRCPTGFNCLTFFGYPGVGVCR